MASFTERINVIIDATTNKASKGLKDFRSAVGEAEGVTGKLKAGTKSLAGMFSSPAGLTVAVTGGAAAAFKAIDEFADLGIQIGKFSDATGLATEDASRWIEVAGDVGIEADTMQSAFGKLGKSIDPKKFQALGIEIARTASGATDMNGTMLNVIDRLNGIADPAERARVATQLLGKGWQGMSELVGQGSSKLKASLAEVSDAKVFDDNKVAKARQFRATMDDVNDVMEDLAITVGESLLPAVVSVLSVIKPMGEGIGWVADQTGKLKQATSDSNGDSFFGNIKENLNWFITNIREGRSPLEAFGGATDDAKSSVQDLNVVMSDGSRIWSNSSDNVQSAAEWTKEEAEAAKEARVETVKLHKSISDLNDIQLDSINGRINLVTSSLELMQAQQDWNDKLKEGKTSIVDMATAANDLAQQNADVAAEQDKVAGKTQTANERTMILAATYEDLQKKLKKGSPLWNAIQAYKEALLSIPTNITTSLSITGAGQGAAGRKSNGAARGPDGERAPHVTVNVNAGVVSNKEELGRHLTEAIQREYKNGTRYPWMGGN